MRSLWVRVAVLLILPLSVGATGLPGHVGPDTGTEPWLALAQSMDGLANEWTPGVADAVVIARAATEQFARAHGWELPVVETAPRTLGDALDLLVVRLGVALNAEAAASLAALDELPEPLRSALAQVVAAFVALHEAATELDTQATAPWSPAHAAVLAARGALLQALPALDAAVQASEITSATLVVAPVLALDLAGNDDVYDQDVALTIDVGGNDLYRNNAGGNRIDVVDRVYWNVRPCITFEPYANRIGTQAAGALIDLGGHDRYEPARGCGVNGGGNNGVGFLFDAGGNDAYTAPDERLCQFFNLGSETGSCGVNGGGVRGIGFLLDAAGNDAYAGSRTGVNGGGYVGGQGYLFDLGGNDLYRGDAAGVNGGAHVLATGLLLDLDGDDRYLATSTGVNGGGDGAHGLLIDLRGSDEYHATHSGANGGAASALGPTLAQVGTEPIDVLVGRGALIDLRGDDLYLATHSGTNGQGHAGSSGILLDAGGADFYLDREGGTGYDRTVVPKKWGAQIDR